MPTRKPGSAAPRAKTAAAARPSSDKKKSSPEKSFAKKEHHPATAPSRSRAFTGFKKTHAENFAEEPSRTPTRAAGRPMHGKKESSPEKPFERKGRRPAAASPRGRSVTDAKRPQTDTSEEESFWAVAGPKDRSFASFLKPLIPHAAAPDTQTILHSSPLAHLDYSVELQVKDQGLLAFWKQHRLPGLPEQVVRSPKARGYRTTSKRKGFLHGSTLYLLLGDKAALPKNRQYFTASPLEPKEHAVIYRFLQQKLSEPAFRLIAGHLNYLIIRGGYTEQAVIFNVDLMNGPLVRQMKLLAAHLQKLP
ncbi:MAG: hypothetical protein KKE82_13775, partial [Proteobacteria bacterium]|nr:hypothetical protein [Pseudomonadota bacterium]MBU1547830.1 hypothetical protein [Pseudomonadota bacterium]